MTDRKSRGLNERIYLLDANFNKEIWKLKIKGSSNRLYNIILSKQQNIFFSMHR